MVVIVPFRDLTKEARAYPSSPDVTRMKPRYLLGFLDLRLERVSNSAGVQPQTRSMNVCASQPVRADRLGRDLPWNRLQSTGRQPRRRFDAVLLPFVGRVDMLRLEDN